jgi:murein peptide amidase A
MPPNTLTYQELQARWKALRRSSNLRVREVACVGAPRTLLCAELGEPALPVIHLCAGVHGDEPAGVLALLEFAERNDFDPRFAYRIWPCTNPTGFDAGTRESVDRIDVNRTFGRGGTSPEAKAIVTANRDFKFVLALDLHEDDEASGFYAYEYGAEGIGARLFDSLAHDGVAVDPRGLVRPNPSEEAGVLGGLSLSLLLCRNAAEHTLTHETAGRFPLAERIAAHLTALGTVLRVL